jgi:hypothetical protein
MCQDRIASKYIPISYECLSIMLGLQRPGLAVVMNELEKRGLIKEENGLVHNLARPALIQLVNGFYGMAETEYERLFGKRKQMVPTPCEELISTD